MPAIRPNWRSSGVAMEEAMVSGLAPGRAAWTEMVGNSTWGIGGDGQKGVGDAAGQRERGGQQRGGDGTVDEGSRDAHGSLKIVGRTPWSARVPLDPLFEH